MSALQRDVVCTVGARQPNGTLELLAPGRMVYVSGQTVVVPGTQLEVGFKVLADVDGQVVRRVRPAALSADDVERFRKVDAVLAACGLGALALGDVEGFLKHKWAEAHARGDAAGPTDPLQELDRRLAEQKRRFPMTWWHDDPSKGADELAQDFLAPRGLSTALPRQELEDDLDRRVAAGQSEADARREAIARLIVEANLLFQRAGLPERFFPFAEYPWEDDEPVWYLLTPEQAEALVAGGVLAAPGAPRAAVAPAQRGALAVLWRPREVFPTLASRPTTFGIVVLAAVWGIERTFYALFRDAFPPQVLGAPGQFWSARLFWGSMFGVCAVWAFGNLVPWTVKKVGGGTLAPSAVRAVLAWAALPRVVSLAFLLVLYARFGDAFVVEDRKALLKAAPGLVGLFSLVYLVASLWSGALGAVGLAAVARLSLWKALTAYVYAGAILLVPVFLGLWLLG